MFCNCQKELEKLRNRIYKLECRVENKIEPETKIVRYRPNQLVWFGRPDKAEISVVSVVEELCRRQGIELEYQAGQPERVEMKTRPRQTRKK